METQATTTRSKVTKLGTPQILAKLRSKDPIDAAERSQMLEVLQKRNFDISEFMPKKEKVKKEKIAKEPKEKVSRLDPNSKAETIRKHYDNGITDIGKIMKQLKTDGVKVYYSEVQRVVFAKCQELGIEYKPDPKPIKEKVEKPKKEKKVKEVVSSKKKEAPRPTAAKEITPWIAPEVQ